MGGKERQISGQITSGSLLQLDRSTWELKGSYADFKSAKKKKKKKPATSAMTRKNKETHLGFICMSIPRILCQLNILKMLKGSFLKKKKKTGMVWHDGGGC